MNSTIRAYHSVVGQVTFEEPKEVGTIVYVRRTTWTRGRIEWAEKCRIVQAASGSFILQPCADPFGQQAEVAA